MARAPHFWESRDPASQRRFFRFSLICLAILFLTAWAGLNYLSRAERNTIEQRRDEYARVTSLVQEVKVLRAALGDLSNLGPRQAIESLVQNYEKFPPVAILPLGNGELEITLPGVPLSDLSIFLRDIRNRANLQTKMFEVGASTHGKGLAHARMVVTR